MSPVAQSDRALNNETCKSLKQQVSSGLLNQRSQVRALSGDFKKALAATLLTYNVCKMVMSDKTDPYECLVETLMSDRYDAVEATLR